MKSKLVETIFEYHSWPYGGDPGTSVLTQKGIVCGKLSNRIKTFVQRSAIPKSVPFLESSTATTGPGLTTSAWPRARP